MKKYIYYITSLLLLFVTSCDSYLETETYNQVPTEDAFNTVDDIKAARNGLYYLLGTYRFVGNYVIAIGDFASDIAVADGSSGHFVSINTYAVSEADDEFDAIWNYGYKVVNNATHMINGINELMESSETLEEDKILLNKYKAEAYGIRAFAYFHLVNVFGLPYGIDDNPHGGLVLMDETAIEPEENVSRSSVVETYAQIQKDIEKSLETYELVDPAYIDNEFYFNPAAVNALSARVKLYMKDYTGAIADAEKAIEIKGVKDLESIPDQEYLEMWTSLTISDEDIFTIVKSEDDNLSANSLNTLYGSYGGAVTQSLIDEFDENDIRLSLIDGTHPKKFDGIESSAATSNIPQFRVSEMKLIIAEASAMEDNFEDARKALFFTAQRNKAITSVDDLPATKEDLLNFIAKERKREFFTEGHRYYDARRTGEKITVANGKYTDFDVQYFVYPIPADEINSGFQCEQNEGWYENLPQ